MEEYLVQIIFDSNGEIKYVHKELNFINDDESAGRFTEEYANKVAGNIRARRHDVIVYVIHESEL